jgi:hypothetical protein
VHLVTDRRADAFAEAVPGVTIDRVRAGRLGGGPLQAVFGLAELAVGMVQARRLLRRLRRRRWSASAAIRRCRRCSPPRSSACRR